MCWASARCLTRDGVPFSCLQAGRTRGAEGGVVSGRKWYPKYYPYGMSKMAAAAERRASACFLPPQPPASCAPETGITCSVPERRYHHTGVLPLRFHCRPCPHVTRQGLDLHRAQPTQRPWATRGPSPRRIPSLSSIHRLGPPRALVSLPPRSCSELGETDGLATEDFSNALCHKHGQASHLLASACLSLRLTARLVD